MTNTTTPTFYRPELGSMNNNQKGAYFLAILKAKLLLSGFIAAVPEPDIGDDLWIAKPNHVQGQIYASQVKSAYTYKEHFKGTIKRYLTNIKLQNLERSTPYLYLYFIGLYDESYLPDRFHIACIPSTFFQDHWSYVQGKIVKDTYVNRVDLHFDYQIQEKQYFLFVKPHVEVTQFFGNFDAIK